MEHDFFWNKNQFLMKTYIKNFPPITLSQDMAHIYAININVYN